MPAAAHLLHLRLGRRMDGLQVGQFRAGLVQGLPERFHILAGALFSEAEFPFPFQPHFRGFQGDHIQVGHVRRGAELPGLFLQLGHMGGAGVAAALQVGEFVLAAAAFRPIVGQARRQKAHAAEQDQIP